MTPAPFNRALGLYAANLYTKTRIEVMRAIDKAEEGVDWRAITKI